MSVLVLLAVAVTTTYAQSSGPSRITCASTSCLVNYTCREVFNRTSGDIFSPCFDNKLYLPTGNERVCSDGQPLWVIDNKGNFSEASCGRVIDRTTCPSDYTCVTSPVDTYAVCCPYYVKSGKCPVPKPGSVGICADMCHSDGNCEGDLKCCRNSCGALTCQSPVLPNKPTCKSTECARGFVCRDTPSGPQCVNATRDGKCPARPMSKPKRPCSKCSSDLDCPGYQKCCPLRPLTSRQCVDPDPSVTCETITCPRGQTCIMKKVICVKAPCFPVPTCV